MFSTHTTASSQNADIHFSLDNYLSYTGLSEFKPVELTIETLTTIIEHHLNKFIYRNTVIFEAGKLPSQDRKIPDLSIDSLFDNMLKNNGGYCFQHIELMCAALTSLGFRVDRHLAKIVLRDYSKLDFEKVTNPKTHELLMIHLHDESYIVDVGMGNLSFRKPLALKEGEQRIGEDEYRLTKQNDKWTLDTKSVKEVEWYCLYQFLHAPVRQADIVKAHQNMYLTDQHISIRDDKLLVSKTTSEKRKYLLWLKRDKGFGLFSSIKLNGEEKKKEFQSFDDAVSFARKKFGIV